MPSPLASREATPSSSSSLNVSADMISDPSISGSSQDQEDAERFLKRMEMEKKLQALQQRLELASVKERNGWTGMTIGEIEQKLPTPPRRRSVNPLALDIPSPIAGSSRGAYEPPSPSRPWQLIDVLWQPLPPPSRGSPLSPRKRSRGEHDDGGHGSPRVNGHTHGHGHGQGHHRRASSAATSASAFGIDPRGALPPQVRKEKRSHSHSHPYTTTQDVDAAKALTSMLGASTSPLRGSASLPIPGPHSPPMRQRAHSLAPSSSDRPHLQTPSSHTRSRPQNETPPDGAPVGGVAVEKPEEPGKEDKDAAELMMFLAHSPSPVSRYSPQMHRTSYPSPGTARVLFADDAKLGKSNLAMAKPITANSNEEEFGAWLGR